MNDPKTIPKVPPVTPAAAEPSGSPEPKDTIPDAKEPFDPFKFQSITMPPGLRGELLEEARHRPPETAPLDTPPPPEDTPQPEGVTLNNDQGDEGATIRIARKLPTERLPRVVFARAQERRRRLAVIVVGFLAGFAGFAAVWSQRDADRRMVSQDPYRTTPPAVRALHAAPATATRPSVAAPVAAEDHASDSTLTSAPPAVPRADAPATPTAAPLAATTAHLTTQPVSQLAASGSEGVTQPPPPAARPGREPSREPVTPKRDAASSRQAAPSKPSASATNVQKPAASNPTGVDLLNFEGPAPKGP